MQSMHSSPLKSLALQSYSFHLKVKHSIKTQIPFHHSLPSLSSVSVSLSLLKAILAVLRSYTIEAAMQNEYIQNYIKVIFNAKQIDPNLHTIYNSDLWDSQRKFRIT